MRHSKESHVERTTGGIHQKKKKEAIQQHIGISTIPIIMVKSKYLYDTQTNNGRLIGNYRPISMLNYTSKIMDKILLRRIKYEEEQLGTIINKKSGCRKYPST